MAAQASGLDLNEGGLARLLEVQQDLIGTCKCNVRPGLVFELLNGCQRVLDLFAELEIFRTLFRGSSTLQGLGAHAPSGCKIDFAQGGRQASCSL